MSLYVSVSEFKKFPTAIEVDNLDQTNIGNQQAQDEALLNILRNASKWVDNICKVNTLEATLDTETKEVHIGRDGRITVHPINAPIINLQSVSYSMSPLLGFTSIPLNMIQTYENYFSVYQFSQNTLSPNLILQPSSLGYINPYTRQRISDLPVILQYSYINGFMNTSLQGSVVAGSNQITVQNGIGASAGLRFTIYDGSYQEDCVVSSVNGNVITLQNPLLFAHNDKTTVSAIPEDVKQATILLASFLVRERGALSITMSETNIGGATNNYTQSSDVDFAKQLLKPYARMVTS